MGASEGEGPNRKMEDQKRETETGTEKSTDRDRDRTSECWVQPPSPAPPPRVETITTNALRGMTPRDTRSMRSVSHGRGMGEPAAGVACIQA